MFYFVGPYDSLELIAWKLGVSMTQLFQYNPITYYYPIHVGQRLYIPLPYPRTLNIYTVASDDTLDSIAQTFNTSKQSIMKLNNLSSEVLVPDQVLTIPVQSYRPYNNYRGIIKYTVQVGDTLDSIADKFQTTKKSLMQLNGLASEVLKAGDILLIKSSKENFTETTISAPIVPYHHMHIALNPKSKYKFLYLHDLYLNKNIDIWKELGSESAIFFVSKMAITAAGEPKAFHPINDLAYDFLDNAGTNGNWWGLVTEEDGFPMIQGIGEPAPGYYISKTALSDCSKPLDDPTRYVNSSNTPYITLPTHHMMGAELGDFCVVINTQNNKIGYAIIADLGPDDSIGIGSMALAKDLGFDDKQINPKSGGIDDGILYIIFPKSGKESSIKCYEECYNKCTENCEEICDKECYEKSEKLWCKPKTRDQIINEAQQLFNQWGGIQKVNALFGQFPLSHANIQ